MSCQWDNFRRRNADTCCHAAGARRNAGSDLLKNYRRTVHALTGDGPQSTLLTSQSLKFPCRLSKLIGAQATDEVQAKRERRKEARPGELLDAALDLFVEKGFAATRAEEVAARAGVSKGTLFLYFPSKEELFKAVVRENISGRFEEWNEEFETFEGTTPDMVRYCMKVWWERVGATKASGITKLIMSEARNFPDLAAFYQAGSDQARAGR